VGDVIGRVGEGEEFPTAQGDELTLERRVIGRYGWKPSLPDYRDFIADTTTLDVLPQVDPRGEMPAVYDQGNLGSCTGNAVAGAVEYDAILSGTHFGAPSRLFIYYLEREIEGSVGFDAGAYGRDGFKACHKIGVPVETLWAYDIARFAERPPPEAYADATKHRIASYKAVPRGILSFKRVLSNRQTIAFGFSVFESFEGGELERTGIMPTPKQGERLLGGHEVLMVGYLEKYPAYALCRNSWGTEWGLGGYFLFPWHLLLDRNFADDFRTIPRPKGR
jgi:C1A family cysteine protease